MDPILKSICITGIICGLDDLSDAIGMHVHPPMSVYPEDVQRRIHDEAHAVLLKEGYIDETGDFTPKCLETRISDLLKPEEIEQITDEMFRDAREHDRLLDEGIIDH